MTYIAVGRCPALNGKIIKYILNANTDIKQNDLFGSSALMYVTSNPSASV